MSQELFDYATQKLEEMTPLDRLEVRGMLRIVLKDAGLEVKSLTIHQLAVVFKKILPQELESRQVVDPKGVCNAIIQDLHQSWIGESETASIDEIFDRLGGRK